MKDLSKKTSIIIWSIVSIVLSVIYVIVCKNNNVYPNALYVERAVFTFLVVEFIGLHIIIGFKNLWDFIIDKRYVIALILLALFTVFEISGSSMGAISSFILEPEKSNVVLGNYRFINSDEYAVELPFQVSQDKTGMNYFSNVNGITDTDMNIDIHSPVKFVMLLFRIYNIGYLFLTTGMAFCFSWNLKVIGALLVTYELLRILTGDKKYLSLIGTIIIVCSSAMGWWIDMISAFLIFGELLVIAVYKYMLSKNSKGKIIWALVFAYSAISYVLALYPAWMVSFGYVYLALIIWVVIKNRKEYKFEKIDRVCIIGTIVLIASAGLYFYFKSYDAIQSILNSSYPGSRSETGGHGLKYLFSYLYSIILPYAKSGIDSMLYASFLSFFPIPLLAGIIYMYKKEKHIEFILPISIVLVVEAIWVMSGFPNALAKLTLFSMVPAERCAVAIGLASIYLMFYMFANIDEKFIKQTHAGYIVLAVLAFLAFVPMPKEFEGKIGLAWFAMIEAMGGFLLLNFADSKYKKGFLGFAIIMTVISGLTINPIAIGIDPINKTDLAKAVQEEVNKNSNCVWITENMDMVVTNYLVAQGAKTLNATETYPSAEFWSKVLGDKAEEYKDIWNRYAHIRVQITNGDSYVALASNDRIELYLTPDKLQELNVKYIVSYNENLLPELNLNKIYFKENSENISIEGEDVTGIYIYEFVN